MFRGREIGRKKERKGERGEMFRGREIGRKGEIGLRTGERERRCLGGEREAERERCSICYITYEHRVNNIYIL